MVELLTWVLLNNGTPDHIGLLPDMLDLADPRPAREQFNERYGYGGGWLPMSGFKLLRNSALQYPGDPPLLPRAVTKLRDEVILVYDYVWVLILQKDGRFEVCRMD